MRNTPNKTLIAGCVAVSAIGLFVTVPAEANAADKICMQYAFNGNFKFTVTQGSSFFSPVVNLTGPSGKQSNVTARPFDSDSVVVGEIHGPMEANIDGRHIHMSWFNGDIAAGEDTHWIFDGEVGDADGIVVGGTGSRNGTGLTWASDAATPLKCVEWSNVKIPDIVGGGDVGGPDESQKGVATAIKADSPPDVTVDVSHLVSVSVTVHDRSSVTSKCTYTASAGGLTPTTKTFDLPADGTYSWDYPAIRTGTTYDVTVDCGGLRKTSQKATF